MSYNATQAGSFVSREHTVDYTNAYTETVFKVGASSTYEPTGSNYSTAFIVTAGTGYTLTPANGGETIDQGIVIGTVVPIALKKVVNSGGTEVLLLR